MYIKLDSATWEEYMNKFDSYKGSVDLNNFCIENKLNKSQFYYYKSILEKFNS